MQRNSCHVQFDSSMLTLCAALDRAFAALVAAAFADAPMLQPMLTMHSQVWALKSKSGELRVALINKDEQQGCSVSVKLGKQYCNQAILSRLLSPGGLLGKAGITWQGQSYANAGYTGKLQGQLQLQQLLPQAQANSSCVYTVPVPAASAALLVSKATTPPAPVDSAALRVSKPAAVTAETAKAATKGAKAAQPAAAAAARRGDVSALRVGKPQTPGPGAATKSSTATAASLPQADRVKAALARAGSALRVGASQAPRVAAAGTPMHSSKPKPVSAVASRTAPRDGQPTKPGH